MEPTQWIQRCAGFGGGVVVALRGSVDCTALSGSTSPAPKLSSRSPDPSRFALEVRMRRMSAGVSFGLRSSSSADQGLSSTTRKRSFVTIAAMSSPMN